MTNNQPLLNNSIEALKLLQIEMHDDIDSSKQIELARVINELESCKTEVTPHQLLIKLARVISWIPVIERILKTLSEL